MRITDECGVEAGAGPGAWAPAWTQARV
jgi:hypothetical protein